MWRLRGDLNSLERGQLSVMLIIADGVVYAALCVIAAVNAVVHAWIGFDVELQLNVRRISLSLIYAFFFFFWSL